MGKIMMRVTDLGELHTLLTMYQDTYGSVPEGFIEQVAEQYHTAAIGHCDAESASIPRITNPRGAGRKSKVKPEDKETNKYFIYVNQAEQYGRLLLRQATQLALFTN